MEFTAAAKEPLVSLINEQNSPNNSVRTAAEIDFNQFVHANPSGAALALMEVASDGTTFSVDIRQSSLLHLKRCIPKYWSLGFGSFIGPTPIVQDVKHKIRYGLLQLVYTTTELKIRSGAAYVIVQIAAVDYPDEWPGLLQLLYQHTGHVTDTTAVVGGFTVLNDLFDDLIDEEQFWEGCVGSEVTLHLVQTLQHPQLDASVKVHCMGLVETVVASLQLPEALSSDDRLEAVRRMVAALVLAMVEQLRSTSHRELRGRLYRALNSILSNMGRKVATQVRQELMAMVLADLSMPAARDECDPFLVELFQLLTTLQASVELFEDKAPRVAVPVFAELLRRHGQVADDAPEINEYVTAVSSLLASLTVRDTVGDLLVDLNASDAPKLCRHILATMKSSDAATLECSLFLLENLFANDASLEVSDSVLGVFLSYLSPQYPPLVVARCCLMLPKFFEKLGDSIDLATRVPEAVGTMMSAVGGSDLCRVALLISLTSYQHLVPMSSFKLTLLQQYVFTAVEQLLDESQDDTLAILLEAVTAAVAVDPQLAQKSPVMEVVLRVAFKEPSDVQLAIDAAEFLKELMVRISEQDYVTICEQVLPGLLKECTASATEVGPPALLLLLDLLAILVAVAPQLLPAPIFNYTFPVVVELLLASVDDLVLQTGSDAFNQLLSKGHDLLLAYSHPQFGRGMDVLLAIISKFLSPDLSDSAALNCGAIVLTVIDTYLAELGREFLSQILDATVKRLLLSKEVVTTENLVGVLCKLVLSLPREMVDFLAASGTLAAVLGVWLDTYEVIRGYEQIKRNTLALARLFSLGDARIAEVVVNGDVIPYAGDAIRTRSMQRQQPDQYTRISASLKILKLLVQELSFQQQQPDPSDFVADDDGGDDWEDMDDIGVPNYDKLKLYVDDDAEHDASDDLKEGLALFFRECTAKDLGGFRRYYDMLTNDEKRIISENVIFA